MNPIFEIFHLNRSLFYTSSRADCPPLSADKNGLSLSHLVSEILGPKIGLILHISYYLTVFLHQFSPLFSNPLTPFFIDLRFF